MATREATYSESSTVVEAKPRMREEVREELREEIRLLELSRVPAAEKLRLERQAVEGAAGEVELFERAYRRTTSETLAEIERAVDALGAGTRPRALPEARRPALAAARPPAAELTEAPAPAPTPVLGPRLAPGELRAIEAHVGGALLTTEVLFNTTRSRVVEVRFRGEGGERSATVVVGEGPSVATLDEIGRKLDGMALPARPPAAEPEPAGPALQVPVERLSPSERRAPIETVEGIGSTYGAQLRKAGVARVEDFFVAEPADVAARTGIAPGLVRKWHDQVLLQAIDGVGPQFSELLVRAGVRDLRHLAEMKPAALAKQLNDHEAGLGKRVQGRTITSELAAAWIRQAQDIVAGAPLAQPEAATPKEAEPEPEPEEPKKGFGLKLGRKKDEPAGEPAHAEPEPAPGPAAAEPEPAKRKFGLKLGRKREESAAEPGAGPAGEPAGPEPAPEAAAAEPEPAKRKFGLKLGRKREESAAEPGAGPAGEPGAGEPQPEEPRKKFGLKLRK